MNLTRVWVLLCCSLYRCTRQRGCPIIHRLNKYDVTSSDGEDVGVTNDMLYDRLSNFKSSTILIGYCSKNKTHPEAYQSLTTVDAYRG